jgi:ATP-dependent helicase/nuclease subunit A
MEWTREQKEAVESEGTDILVSAGAGSGKTAVLTARIVRAVLDRENPCNVDEIVVVTFTKKAANEMRTRISKQLDARLSATEDPVLIRRISDQQVRLSRAWISTIDSFCKRILLENVRESGIDASFSVCDDAERDKMLSDAVSAAAEELSASEPDRYAALVDVYGDYKTDRDLLEKIVRAVNFSLSFPDPEKWLRDCIGFFREPFPDGDFARTAYGRWLISRLRINFEAQLSELRRLAEVADSYGLGGYRSTLEEDAAMLEHIPGQLAREDITWQEVFDACGHISFGKLKQNSKQEKEGLRPENVGVPEQIKDKRNNVKSKVAAAMNMLFMSGADDPETDRQRAADEMETFIGLCLSALELFRQEKTRRRVYDYGDMEHRCLEVLTAEEGRVALSYRRKFAEIFVDEYQDTNMLQELILKSISGSAEGETPHLFMVGDMKQGIYAFRDACPELFVEKYDAFTDLLEAENRAAEEAAAIEAVRTTETAGANCANGADNADNAVPADEDASIEGELIRLNANFRSRREVIDSVNAIFSSLIDPITCGMPYGPEEYLNFGATDYPEIDENGEIADGANDTEDTDGGVDGANDAEGGVDGEGRRSPYKTEIVVVKGKGMDPEFHEITCRIKEMIASRMPVYDREAKVTRPVRYGDVCILIRYLTTHGRELAEYLRKGGVPVKDTSEKSGLFSHPEVKVATSLLKIIDNPLNDIPLIAVLKNVYGFTADTLARIKIAAPEREINFYSRMERFAAETGPGTEAEAGAGAETEPGAGTDGPDEAARALVRAFLRRLDYLRDMAYRTTATELLWTCLSENGFLEACGKLPDGGVAYGNLMKLVRMAMNYDNSGRGSFCGFVRLLGLYEKKNTTGPASPGNADQNAVTISTIHSSKGLEYPVVIIGSAGSARNKNSEKGTLLIHPRLGLGPTCLDRRTMTKYPSVMKEAVKMKLAADARAEELRVLYVAMTRAKEKLLIIGSLGGRGKKDPNEFISGSRSKLDLSGRKPLDYYILNEDTYLALLAMAAVSENARGKCDISEGSFYKEVAGGQDGQDGVDGVDGAEGTPFEGGNDGDDGDWWDDEIAGAPWFGLPRVDRWTGGGTEDGDDRPARPVCPSKVSVSEIKRISNGYERAIDDGESDDSIPVLFGNRTELKTFDDPDDTPGKFGGKSGGALAGTLLHCCLEHMDFGVVRDICGDVEKAAEYAGSLISELAEKRFFDAVDAGRIPVKLLIDFICSPFATEIASSDRIMREVPFALDLPSDELFSEPSFKGSATTVQGVMDCVTIKGDVVTLIDYKSDFVPGEDLAAHSAGYELQLRIYSEVCRRIFGKYPDKTALYYLRYGKEYLI